MQGLMNERGEPCHVSLDLPPRLPACNARHSRFHRGAKTAQGKGRRMGSSRKGRKGSLHSVGFKDSYSLVEIRLNVLTCCFCLITLSICTKWITFISGSQIKDTTDKVHDRSLLSKKVAQFCFWICLCCFLINIRNDPNEFN